MYKWVDKEGNTHYTQQPPPAGIESEKLNPPPAFDSSEAVKTLEEQQEYLDTEREKREKHKKALQRAADDKARLKKNCDSNRARLKSLTDKPRVMSVQADGSVIRLTEEKRQEEIAKAEKAIKEFCK